MVRNLIWDVDGTLFDTYPAMVSAFQSALADFGVSTPGNRILELAKKSIEFCIITLAEQHVLDIEELAQCFSDHYRNFPPGEQTLFPGAVDICAYICAQGGVNLIVTHRGRQSMIRLLHAHNMAHYFTDIAAGDDGYPRKPDPASFNTLIEKHALNREETLAIGDRELDILAGQAAHLRTCLFGDEVIEAAPDLRIRDYAQFLQVLTEGKI